MSMKRQMNRENTIIIILMAMIAALAIYLCVTIREAVQEMKKEGVKLTVIENSDFTAYKTKGKWKPFKIVKETKTNE